MNGGVIKEDGFDRVLHKIKGTIIAANIGELMKQNRFDLVLG